jgi:hypothetical protein
MWIIPKKLIISPYVQGTEALISDSQELSEILKRSVLWRSKPSPSKTWLRRLKRDCSISRLYTRILKPSRSESFVDAWTSSQGASLVNHSQEQGNAQGQKTLDTYSPTSSTESDCAGLPLFFWRTLKESSQVNSKETTGTTPKAHPFCSMPLESWNEWVTNRRREYSVRLKLARLTKEKECSSWRSPTASMSGAESASTEPLFTRGGEAQTPATPQAEGKSNTDGSPREQWGTPTSRDHKGHYPKWSQESPEKETRNLLPDQAHGGTYRGKLNSRWVETLMGLPVGWTMPSCASPWTIERTSSDCSETELCPQPQSAPFASCGKIYLEPREQYDPFILEETEEEIVYDGAEIVAYLIEMFQKEGAAQEDADTMGIEWFYFNIDRLSDYYAISFKESDE